MLRRCCMIRRESTRITVGRFATRTALAVWQDDLETGTVPTSIQCIPLLPFPLPRIATTLPPVLHQAGIRRARIPVSNIHSKPPASSYSRNNVFHPVHPMHDVSYYLRQCPSEIYHFRLVSCVNSYFIYSMRTSRLLYVVGHQDATLKKERV